MICLVFSAAVAAFAALVFVFDLNSRAANDKPELRVSADSTPLAPVPSPPPSAVPSPSASAQPGYTATSIVIDGSSAVTLASREAAEELINNVISYYNGLFPHASSKETVIENTVGFAASPGSSSIVSYDTAFSLLTGSGSPLRVVTTIRYSEIETIAHDVEIREDYSLYKGTRYIEVYGGDGQRINVFESVYINGVEETSAKLEAVAAIAPVKEVIRVGTRPLPDDGYTPNGSWGISDCPNIGLRFIKPCEGDVTRYFGFYGKTFHNGLDFDAPPGSDIKAACSGKIKAALERGEYGLVIEIDCGDGAVLRCAGLASLAVSVGDSVNSGDIIGSAGTGGLHIEMLIDGVPRNPRPYLFGLI